jgi:hypothetical protein
MESIAPNQVLQQTPGRDHQTQQRSRPRNPLRAESVVKVTEPYAELIRASAIKEQYKTFDSSRDTLTVLDAHNSYTNYVKYILPIAVPDYIIPATENATEKYKCGPILSKIWECDHFFPKDLKMKWKVIVRNMTAINGQNYRRNAQSRLNPVQPSAASQSTPEEAPREYQPAAINHVRNEKRESSIRRNLFMFFSNVDKEIKKQYDEKNFDWPVVPTELAARWKYEDPVNKPEESSEAKKRSREEIENHPAKKMKTSDSPGTSTDEELSIDDACVICMEKPRTHAFLHYGLSSQDVSSHFVACEKCANSCRWADQGCPCCRAPVINIIRVLK